MSLRLYLVSYFDSTSIENLVVLSKTVCESRKENRDTMMDADQYGNCIPEAMILIDNFCQGVAPDNSRRAGERVG